MKKVLLLTSCCALAAVAPTAARAQAPALAMHEGAVYLLTATPGAPKALPLFESLQIVHLQGSEYRLITPTDDKVTFHAAIEGNRLSAISEGPGIRFSLVATVDESGDARGTFSVTDGSKVLATGDVSLGDVSKSPPKPVCPPALAEAGWGVVKGRCAPPNFAASTALQQASDGKNLWTRFCTSPKSKGICSPVNMSSTLFAWDPDPRLGNVAPATGQGAVQ